jgi:hypothetical protein
LFSYCRIGTSRSVSHFEGNTLKRFIVDENYSLLPDPRDHCFWIDYVVEMPAIESISDLMGSSKSPFQVLTPKVKGRGLAPIRQRPIEVAVNRGFSPMGAKPRLQQPILSPQTFAQFTEQNSELLKESIANRSYSRLG